MRFKDIFIRDLSQALTHAASRSAIAIITRSRFPPATSSPCGNTGCCAICSRRTARFDLAPAPFADPAPPSNSPTIRRYVRVFSMAPSIPRRHAPHRISLVGSAGAAHPGIGRRNAGRHADALDPRLRQAISPAERITPFAPKAPASACSTTLPWPSSGCAQGRIQRAAVVDLDVHQGDGTALIFEDDPDVLTLSMHGEEQFPFPQAAQQIDVELPDGTGDPRISGALADVLPRVFEFEPGYHLLSVGRGCAGGDSSGRLALTHEGLRERDRLVIGRRASRGIPLVITLGGGYADPIERTAEAHANTFRTAADSSVLLHLLQRRHRIERHPAEIPHEVDARRDVKQNLPVVCCCRITPIM